MKLVTRIFSNDNREFLMINLRGNVNLYYAVEVYDTETEEITLFEPKVSWEVLQSKDGTKLSDLTDLLGYKSLYTVAVFTIKDYLIFKELEFLKRDSFLTLYDEDTYISVMTGNDYPNLFSFIRTHPNKVVIENDILRVLIGDNTWSFKIRNKKNLSKLLIMG